MRYAIHSIRIRQEISNRVRRASQEKRKTVGQARLQMETHHTGTQHRFHHPHRRIQPNTQSRQQSTRHEKR